MQYSKSAVPNTHSHGHCAFSPPHGYKAEAEVPCFKFMTKYLELQLTGSWLPPFSPDHELGGKGRAARGNHL